MKTLARFLCLFIALIPIEAFRLIPTNPSTKKVKVGVWKTYDDYAKGNLTDLGEVTENHNAWKDHGVFFDKEHVMPEDTKYWGARIPQFEQKAHSFVNHAIPVPNTSEPKRFANGTTYSVLINPMPIGIFYLGTAAGIRFDSKGDVIDLYGSTSNNSVLFFASKGDGNLVRTHEREECRSLFDDDPEIQKAYDNDETFKGHAQTATKKSIVFIKYVVRYNKKHTPGYAPQNFN